MHRTCEESLQFCSTISANLSLNQFKSFLLYRFPKILKIFHTSQTFSLHFLFLHHIFIIKIPKSYFSTSISYRNYLPINNSIFSILIFFSLKILCKHLFFKNKKISEFKLFCFFQMKLL